MIPLSSCYVAYTTNVERPLIVWARWIQLLLVATMEMKLDTATLKTVKIKWNQWSMCNISVLFCSVLFCSVLFCSVLFCSVLFCSVLFCSVQFFSVLFCSVLFCSVLFCSVLFCSVLFCSVLFCSVPFCSVLFCSVFVLSHVCSVWFDNFSDLQVKIKYFVT